MIMRKVMPTQKSWSQLCRERIAMYAYAIKNAKNEEDYCIQKAWDNLSHSYRPTIFKIRCAKLLRKAILRGDIKENSVAAENYRNYVNEIKEIYGFDARWVD